MSRTYPTKMQAGVRYHWAPPAGYHDYELLGTGADRNHRLGRHVDSTWSGFNIRDPLSELSAATQSLKGSLVPHQQERS